MKSLAAVHWVKDNRLRGLSGMDLDEAAAKIFYVVNGGNIRQAFDRLNSGLPQAEREIKEVTRHIAPNYWEAYKDRGNGRPYFLVMPPSAMYVQDPVNAPSEFESETRRIMSEFADQITATGDDPLDPDMKEALLELSEIPLLREKLATFIRNERLRTQLREAESRVRKALSELKGYYENELADRNVYPPFSISWEALQEKRFENLIRGLQKDLPRAFHAALVELSHRTNNDAAFRRMIRPTLDRIQGRVKDAIGGEIEELMDQYGTEHWDSRDVTYDNLIWGTSGIELPIKRILYQVELTMQEAVSRAMPSLGDAMLNELRRTLSAHEIKSRLTRADYEQGYTYSLPNIHGEVFNGETAYEALIERVATNFRQVCEQAVMYELMKVERSVNYKLAASEQVGLASNERLLDVALNGADAVAATMPSNSAPQPAAPAAVAGSSDDFVINILNDDNAPAAASDDLVIRFAGEEDDVFDTPSSNATDFDPFALEASYNDKLEDVGDKTRRIFDSILSDLFSDDDLLPRLRRLFWLEATRAERDFNNHIVKPLLRNHDRRLHDADLRAIMEPDLESISDMEGLMRTWEGLDKLESHLGF
ncbi:MAG TPA: hypothetical protein ENJ56_07975 [Anaerolineae bacterium]|nr:hypothetical protein [Anaerolineae bacterium]